MPIVSWESAFGWSPVTGRRKRQCAICFRPKRLLRAYLFNVSRFEVSLPGVISLLLRCVLKCRAITNPWLGSSLYLRWRGMSLLSS